MACYSMENDSYSISSRALYFDITLYFKISHPHKKKKKEGFSALILPLHVLCSFGVCVCVT